MTVLEQHYGELRPLLFSLAYRMVGSVVDAEDIVQEAFARAAGSRDARIESPRAYLTTVTTRLAIDHLRSARVRRESYVGPWLPEPLVGDGQAGPEELLERSDSLAQAFLLVLEALTPVERAVFLLHEVFGYDYDEVAAVVGKSAVNCRQIAARARRHVQRRRRRPPARRSEHGMLLSRFLAAAETGDTDALEQHLASDAALYSDGGGRAVAARRPIHGADRVARFMAGVARLRRRRGEELAATVVDVNGRPGRVLTAPDGRVEGVLAIDVADGRIQGVYIVRNPDKLRSVASGVATPAPR